MCRDGFRAQCVVVGCEQWTGCRDSLGYCHDHDPMKPCDCDDECLCPKAEAEDPVKQSQWHRALRWGELRRAEVAVRRAWDRLNEADAEIRSLTKAREGT